MQLALSRSSESTTEHQPEQQRIGETVQRCLDDSGYAQLSNVACRCCAGTVVLTGQVTSFYMKQIAQTIARQVDGVQRVDNLLEVPAK